MNLESLFFFLSEVSTEHLYTLLIYLLEEFNEIPVK